MNRCKIIIGLITATALYGQSADDIIKKAINAHGGVEAVEKYQNYSAEGRFKVFNGNEFSGEFEHIQIGNKSYRKLNLNFGGEVYTVINVFNGKTAFTDQMGNITNSPSLNYESDLDHTIQSLLKSNADITLDKVSKTGDAVAIQVEHGGKHTTFYINQLSYQIVEMVYRDSFINDNKIKETFEKRVIYEDYQETDNVIFPMKQTFYEKGSKTLELSFSRIVFDPEIDDSQFTRPKQDIDTRYREERMD